MENIDRHPTIYTTGAHLRPTKITYPNGREEWRWIVVEFEDDSFEDGDVFNPPESASTLKKLLKDTTGEE